MAGGAGLHEAFLAAVLDQQRREQTLNPPQENRASRTVWGRVMVHLPF